MEFGERVRLRACHDADQTDVTALTAFGNSTTSAPRASVSFASHRWGVRECDGMVGLRNTARGRP